MSTVALKTLLAKEVRRFSKVWLQTVLSPLVTTSLYFLVFGVALGSRLREISGVPYIQFVVPGLVMMTMIRDAFLNTSSSLFQSKINGTITDILVAPIGALEMVVAYVGAAMLRAFITGALVYIVALTFTDDDFAAHVNLVHALTHGFYSHLVGNILFTLTHPASRCDRSLLDNFNNL